VIVTRKWRVATSRRSESIDVILRACACLRHYYAILYIYSDPRYIHVYETLMLARQ
jgi:hypothetical protein